MKKYEIIKDGLDNYILKYKDKEIQFNSTVNLVSKLQDITRQARMRMITDLAKEGKTIKDLIVETEENGKGVVGMFVYVVIEDDVYDESKIIGVFQNENDARKCLIDANTRSLSIIRFNYRMEKHEVK